MKTPLVLMKIRPSQYGAYNPISNTFGVVRKNHSQVHQGWDLLAKPGTPAFAISDGELTHGVSKTYGNWLSLQFNFHGDVYYAFYAHLGERIFKNGFVSEGAMIAYTGRTGVDPEIPNSESHLHFEIRTIKNPAPGLGLAGRVDPGKILGYYVYSCYH